MKKTYVGSCHCGAVRYEVDIDLSEGTFKCNCSICTKTRNWLAVVKPDAFRLLAGEAETTEYLFNTKSTHHLFCKHCGVRSFGWGDSPELGGKFYAINVNCLDNVDIDELVSAPITYVDGRNNNWQSPPTETRHL
ncbi:MAG TPA: GFA family protein [Thermodesulfobacteriota bacterium]|nr:GFA family protein [Thermodesulfobacteriota bacterium]